ncbi:FIG002577: Putative lipoprotein precursor [Pseudoalteromonas luteoviolacea B = ATCC 29581]|nr:FIG002577: Putative lipoprotein precursor [Pseudoalteromonas luteoviolacea B = ATCC 29581]
MRWVMLIWVGMLSGCGLSIDGNTYINQKPKLDPIEYFNGSVKGWGIVQDRSGNVIQQFTVELNGSLKDEKLVLDEQFQYQLGEGVKTRVWTISQPERGKYIGQASDILASASGEIFGNALQWKYEMDLPVSGTTYRVQFDDWMWRFDNETVMNRSYIKKFGVVFAEVTLFFQKKY